MRFSQIVRGFFRQNRSYYEDLKKKRDIRATKIPPRDFYEQVHKQASPLFVLSTGRSGTMLMTRIFELCDQATVVHEPQPELEYFSRIAYENKDKQDYISIAIDAARYEMIRDEHLLGKTYVETNNRITFFAYALAELYPNAKFIHLVRKPKGFVQSGCSRGWYENNFHDEGRITPIFGEHHEKWEKYSQEQKIAWLWNETNAFIEDFKGEYEDRTVMVTLEELVKNVTKAEDLFDFAGLNRPKRTDIDRVLKKKENKGKPKLDLSDVKGVERLTPLYKTYY